MNIYIGADHRGYTLKGELIPYIEKLGHHIIDCGNSVYDPNDDFPDVTFAVCDRVIADSSFRGIVICGTAGGVTIAANKVKGVRCAHGVNEKDVRHDRDHNDINILSIGADQTKTAEAKKLVKIFLETEFSRLERCVRRLDKIAARETA